MDNTHLVFNIPACSEYVPTCPSEKHGKVGCYICTDITVCLGKK